MARLKANEQVTVVFTPLGFKDDFPERVVNLNARSPTIMVGRSSKNDIKNLSSAQDNAFFDSPVMSREHAKIWVTPANELCIEDVGSTHGTFLDKMRLMKKAPYVFRNGALVKFGCQVMRDEVTYPARSFKVTYDWNQTCPEDSESNPLNKGFSVPDENSEDDGRGTKSSPDEAKEVPHIQAGATDRVATPVSADEIEVVSADSKSDRCDGSMMHRNDSQMSSDYICPESTTSGPEIAGPAPTYEVEVPESYTSSSSDSGAEMNQNLDGTPPKASRQVSRSPKKGQQPAVEILLESSDDQPLYQPKLRSNKDVAVIDISIESTDEQFMKGDWECSLVSTSSDGSRNKPCLVFDESLGHREITIDLNSNKEFRLPAGIDEIKISSSKGSRHDPLKISSLCDQETRSSREDKHNKHKQVTSKEDECGTRKGIGEVPTVKLTAADNLAKGNDNCDPTKRRFTKPAPLPKTRTIDCADETSKGSAHANGPTSQDDASGNVQMDSNACGVLAKECQMKQYIPSASGKLPDLMNIHSLDLPRYQGLHSALTSRSFPKDRPAQNFTFSNVENLWCSPFQSDHVSFLNPDPRATDFSFDFPSNNMSINPGLISPPVMTTPAPPGWGFSNAEEVQPVVHSAPNQPNDPGSGPYTEVSPTGLDFSTPMVLSTLQAKYCPEKFSSSLDNVGSSRPRTRGLKPGSPSGGTFFDSSSASVQTTSLAPQSISSSVGHCPQIVGSAAPSNTSKSNVVQLSSNEELRMGNAQPSTNLDGISSLKNESMLSHHGRSSLKRKAATQEATADAPNVSTRDVLSAPVIGELAQVEPQNLTQSKNQLSSGHKVQPTQDLAAEGAPPKKRQKVNKSADAGLNFLKSAATIVTSAAVAGFGVFAFLAASNPDPI